MVMTGGTGVLGHCISVYLAGQGAKMVILGRNEQAGAAIVSEMEQAGGEGMFIKITKLFALHIMHIKLLVVMVGQT